MPLAAAVVGSAILGAGATLYSSSQAKKASDKALDAQNLAAQQQLAAQQANFNRIDTLNQPFIQGGTAAFDRLLGQYGITRAGQPGTPATPPAVGGVAAGQNGSVPAQGDPNSPWVAPNGSLPGPSDGPSGGGAGTAGAGGGVDYQRLFQDRPDVRAEYDKVSAQADPNSPWFAQHGLDRGPEGFADWWLANKPAQDSYTAPTVAAQPQAPTPPTTTPTAPTGPDYPGGPFGDVPDYMNSKRPDAAQAPTFDRPQDTAAPNLASYLSDFKADPGYQFRVNEAIKGVNAGSAVRGKLRSGDAALAIEGRASDLANQGYNDWFNRQLAQFGAAQGQYQYGQSRKDNNFSNDRAYGTSLWQNNRDFANNNFSTDRAYQTGRYDTNTGNLFNLTNVGLTGAGNVSGAGTNFANAQSNIYGSQANAASDAAYARANANSQAVGGLAGAAGNLFAAWGGGAGSVPAGGAPTVGQAWNHSLGGGWQTPYTGSVNPYVQPVF